MAGSFRWEGNSTLFDNSARMKSKASSYLSKATQFHSMKAETYMKSHAPWTDRTGNARSGLAAFANVDGAESFKYEIILYGQVNYQWWLETRNAVSGVGRYAIIVPTIRAESPAYFETARRVMQEVFGGLS